MKHCVSSGRTCTVSHVHPAADHQLIQQASITFSDSSKAIVCWSCRLLIHPSSSCMSALIGNGKHTLLNNYTKMLGEY